MRSKSAYLLTLTVAVLIFGIATDKASSHKLSSLAVRAFDSAVGTAIELVKPSLSSGRTASQRSTKAGSPAAFPARSHLQSTTLAEAQTAETTGLARLSDGDEILAVATKSENTDVAVAALDRISDRQSLSLVAQRARSKVAARRAKTRLHMLEESMVSAAADAAIQMSPVDRRRTLDLLHRTEALVGVADPDAAAQELMDARLAWAELQADVEVDSGLAHQVEAAAEAVREAIAERERERGEEQERARALAEEQAGRVEICAAIEQLAGAESADRIAELKVRWDALPPMRAEYAASLTRRFQGALRTYEDNERRRVLAEAAATRTESLSAELEQLAGSDHPLDDVVARWRALRRDADLLREHLGAGSPAGERLERVVGALEVREEEYQQRRVLEEQNNLRRLQQICRQVEALTASETISLKAGERALSEIKAALEQKAPLPSRQERQEIHARLETLRGALGPRVQQLREADEWQRWANLQVQNELCREMEALKANDDLEAANRIMRELQGRWKQVALAPRAQGEAMWRRFKTAQDEVFARTSAFMAGRQQERAANLAAKHALIERAEALADSRDWVKTAAEIQSLQAQWKGLGPVTAGREKATWERFRAACDRFFTRRQEDLKRRKEEWSVNLAKKEALCARAAELVESREWESTALEFRRLQAEWKSVGPVRKSKSDEVWQRFRSTCDRFFERYKHRDRVELQAKAEPREDVIRDLEAFSSADAGDAALSDLAARVQDARSRWQQAPELPRQLQQDLAARYYDALGRVVSRWPAAFAGTDLDPEMTRTRMETLIAKVESLGASQSQQGPALTPAEQLAQQWRERLAANTMTGGRAAETDESRWRASEQEVKSAQAQWMRLGPVGSEIAGPLNERFQQACRRFFEMRRRAS